ncbi:MAG: chromosomal replication initiator protein DnaA [Rickettsiales bacterium]
MPRLATVASYDATETYCPDLWPSVAATLRRTLGESVYGNWLSQLDCVASTPAEMVLSAPSRFVRDWIHTHYARKIQGAAREAAGRHVIVRIEVAAAERPTLANAEPLPIIPDDAKTEECSSPLSPSMRFDRFIVGGGNKMAYQAAHAVCESTDAWPGAESLFLYGAVGLGKTHLLQAIAHRMREERPELRTVYMSAEKFMFHYVTALRNKEAMRFKEDFRNVDMFIVDDVQFICGKNNTQEEFFHTLTALLDHNKRVVVAADRPPHMLEGLNPRLQSRLGGGLTVGMRAPCYALRYKLLEDKCGRYPHVGVDDEVMALLAEKIAGSVRDLEGALNRVIAHAVLLNRRVTRESAENILSDMPRADAAASVVPSVADVQKKVAEYYGVAQADLLSSGRTKNIVLPRQVAMYLCKRLTTRSLGEISRKFEKKDHTTVMHAVKRIDLLRKTDAELDKAIERLDLALRR